MFTMDREKKCCQFHYQLILCDLDMPVLDGFGASRKISKYQKDCKSFNTPIVAVSAFQGSKIQRKCKNAGMISLLTKPVSNEAVINIFNTLVPQIKKKASH